MSSDGRPHLALWLVPIGALGVALFELPYGYYQLLRVLLFCASCYLGYWSHLRHEQAWSWVFAALAITYNPFIRLHLGADVWPFVNIATILVLGVHRWALVGKTIRREQPKSHD
jgi:hypothetical protein